MQPPPAFTKLGTKADRPSWLVTAGAQMFFPRVFKNDLHRATLTGLPAPRFSVLGSSDHATTGLIIRHDFDDIEGTWTDSGAAVHTEENSLETPHPVYDEDNQRVNVYMHRRQPSGGALYNTQHTRLYTTVDLATFTDQGVVIDDGQHTGYAQVVEENGVWTAYHLFIGGDGAVAARSVCTDGVSFTRNQIVHNGHNHIAGTGNGLYGGFYYAYQGTLYRWGFLNTKPFASNLPTKAIATPVNPTTLRPIGGYYELFDLGEPGADDFSAHPYVWVGEIDGTLYIVYTGQESGGESHWCLAKASEAEATQQSPLWAPLPNGDLSPRLKTNTTIVDWDAQNDDLPAAMTVEVIQGSNQSSHSEGNYYEVKTGSGAAQNLRLKTTATFNPAEYEAIDFTIRDLKLQETSSNWTTSTLFFGIANASTHGVRNFWSNADMSRRHGRLSARNNGVETLDDTFVWPFHDAAMVNGIEFPRWTGVDLTFRIHNFGQRLSILIDGHVSYHADISSIVSWDGGCSAQMLLQSLTPFPGTWARFTGVQVTAYDAAPPAGPLARSGNRRQRALRALLNH